MSRGKQGGFTFVAALATVACMAVAPAFAVTTSGSVAATDDRAPEPVSNVSAFNGPDGVEVSWDLSPSDFVRQAPTGSDFTSGGTFVNVNDVIGYDIWVAEGGLEPQVLDRVAPGTTSFVDALPTGSSLVYSVTAVDAAGNGSEIASALPVTLGEPGAIGISPDISSVTFADLASDDVGIQTFVIENVATGADANLSVSVSVEGAGWLASSDLISLTPGNSTSLDVSFGAADVGNINGEYPGVLTIRTNDPDRREIIISLSATITDGLGIQDISVTPLTLAFSRQRLLNTTGQKSVVLSNEGGLPLTGSFELSGSSAYSVSASLAISRAPGTSRTIQVQFTPTTEGEHTGTLTFTTDDPDEPVVTVSLTGRGVTQLSTAGKVVTKVVKVRVTLDSDIDLEDEIVVENFKANFRSVVAASLNINPNRIKNIVIVAGSVIATFDIRKDETAVASGEPTAVDAAATLTAALADPADDPIQQAIEADVAPVLAVEDLTADVELLPEDADGNIIYGWFSRQGESVGFDDFFLFADNFGLTDGTDEEFDPLYDIFPPEEPDGTIGFDDFFLFADQFGLDVANAAEIQEALE